MLPLMVIVCFLINSSYANPHKEEGHSATPQTSANCHVSVNHTVVSFTVEGQHPCMSDCVDGYCHSSWTTCEPCTAGEERALIYHTSRYKQPTKSTCLSKCGYFGEEYTWCAVGDDRTWDYCNAETENRVQVQNSSRYGFCRTECDNYGTKYLWCWTWWGGQENWDYCEKEKFTIDRVRTVYGKECRGECKKHDGQKFYTCIDSSREMNLCALSAHIA